MATHIQHPPPSERKMFLVDGCPRCKEYVRDFGLHFDPERFREFWKHMYEIEFKDGGGYASNLDKQLGRSLYYVALSFQKAGFLLVVPQ